ncbi:MAG: metal transporter [Desulfobacterales bacterium]|nr:metal transporter [Desulfobacterales bacterium]MCP4160561.1 metal transporter [Deltaproteobacteria bacterium]
MKKVNKKRRKSLKLSHGKPFSLVRSPGVLGLEIFNNLTHYKDFSKPFFTASRYFNSVEYWRSINSNPFERFISLSQLFGMNTDLLRRGLFSTFQNVGDYFRKDMTDMIHGLINTFQFNNSKDVETFQALIYRKFKTFELLTQALPQAVLDSEKEFGFHFERCNNKKIAETVRFKLYRITPTDKGVKTDPTKKPVLIIPPYVLGANILAFLPNQNKSYVHSFANKGIPTYIRIQKDIIDNEPVQLMTPEDDTNDTVVFCEKIKKIHGKQVTLNGYCQGGFFAVCNILSGKLDGLVDTLITNVAPMDGTKNKGLKGFLNNLPTVYNNLSYGTKTLPNGNKIADGEIMSWIYKLNSIENETPIVSLLKKVAMFDFKGNKDCSVNLTYAALNYWLSHEKTDLPLEITRFSYDSFSKSVEQNGELPVRLFGEHLNFKRISEKNIKWMICYGENDDLVEKSSALAPLDHIPVETTSFPKGHVAIATSWSDPDSKYALDKRFGKRKGRGPVLFHMERDEELYKKQ